MRGALTAAMIFEGLAGAGKTGSGDADDPIVLALARIRARDEKGTPVPGLHSSEFAPLPEPTLRTGVKAMTSAVLDLLKK